MRTVEDVRREFEMTEWGTIKGPGKFEGEMPWVVLAYESELDGHSDDILYDEYDRPTHIHIVTDEMRAAWGFHDKDMFDDGDTVYACQTYQSDSGFVIGYWLTRAEYDSVYEAYEKLCEEMPDDGW